MRKRKYSAALIGTGRIGFTLGFDKKREQPASHTMALNADKRISLDFGCDSDSDRLEFWRKFNRRTAVYSSFSYLFAASKPDIVVIAVNEKSHLPVCLAAVRARPRLIILEKPVALNVCDGIQILEEASDYGVPVLVNHERRFAEDYKTAKKYVSEIGKIITINARLDSGMCVYDPAEEGTGEYSLLHDGTHLVDCVMYLLEDSTGENGVLYNADIKSYVFDSENCGAVRSLSVHFESRKCADVNFMFSGESRYFGFEIDVIGSAGRIRIGNGIFEFYKRDESSLYSGFYSLVPDKKIKKPVKTRYFSNMVRNAVDFLDGKDGLKSSVQTGINTLKVLEEIKALVKDCMVIRK